MAQVVFTENLQRHLSCPPQQVEASTVREALDAVFAGRAEMRGYVLDDQGALRHHMAVFVDGEHIQDRRTLADPVKPNSEIYVMQALSGG